MPRILLTVIFILFFEELSVLQSAVFFGVSFRKGFRTMSVYFSWIDYTLFIMMLLTSVAIGIYYSFSKKRSSAQEYLLGGKSMSVWPTSLSLVSSCISGTPLLIFPAELYVYGISIALIIFEIPLLMAITYFIYLPVFHKLEVTSIYAYFQLRFDKKMRIMTSLLYTIYMMVFLPFVIYVPSLALAQVTGFPIGVLNPILCGICIFYTTVGGLKAVVLTDALQFFFMMGSMIVVVTVGIIRAGSLDNVWNTASENGRLHVNFDPDITLRDTFWSGTIGLFFVWLNIVGINQGTIQKCLSLPSYKDMRKAVTISTVTLTILMLFVYFSGLAMYANYFDCDPLTSKKIAKIDQLVPFFITDVSQNMPGLSGLFIAGILSAALSTLSAGMNCVAATTYDDFIKPFLNKNISDQTVTFLLKMLVVIIGAVCTCLVYVIEQFGSLLPLIISLMGIVNGPIIGIFTTGMMMPMVNSIGVLIGAISSVCLMCWIIIGAQFYRAKHPYLPLPVSIAGCAENISFASMINATQPVLSNDDGFFLYKISHNYYGVIGFLTVVIVSVAISYFTKNKSKAVPRECITPFLQFLLPKEDTHFSTEEARKLTENNYS